MSEEIEGRLEEFEPTLLDFGLDVIRAVWFGIWIGAGLKLFDAALEAIK